MWHQRVIGCMAPGSVDDAAPEFPNIVTVACYARSWAAARARAPLLAGMTLGIMACGSTESPDPDRLAVGRCEPGARAMPGDSDRVITAPQRFPCTIGFTPAGTVLAPDPSGARPDPDGMVVVRSSGSHYLTASTEPGRLLLFDSTGRLIRVLGRVGDGPGELRRGFLDIVPGPANTFLVADAGGRLTWFDSTGARGTLDPLTIRADWRRTVVIGERIVSSAWPGRDGAFYFRATALDGTDPYDFGEVDSVADPRQLIRPVTIATDSSFWAGTGMHDPRGPLLEEWTVDGRLLRRVQLDLAWLRRTAGGERNREPPTLLRMWMTSPTHLWVVSSAPTNQWKPRMTEAEEDEAYEVSFDVVDMASRALLAHSTFRGTVAEREAVLSGFGAGSPLGYRFIEDSAGLRSVLIIRQSLTPATARR
jgi:hypothetical protein